MRDLEVIDSELRLLAACAGCAVSTTGGCRRRRWRMRCWTTARRHQTAKHDQESKRLVITRMSNLVVRVCYSQRLMFS